MCQFNLAACRVISYQFGMRIINGVVSEQKAQLSLGKADHIASVWSPASDFQSRRESDLSEVTQFRARYVNGTLSRKLKLTLV